jgi:hypothetical protein
LEANILFLEAIDKYENALNLMPSNKDTLFFCTLSWLRLLLIRAEIEEWIDTFGICFDSKDFGVQRTEEYFEVLVDLNPKDSRSLCMYAFFLEKKRDFSAAEGNLAILDILLMTY